MTAIDKLRVLIETDHISGTDYKVMANAIIEIASEVGLAPKAPTLIERYRRGDRNFTPEEWLKIQPIPSGVYYSLENDNFYDVSTLTGMGIEFDRRWYARRDEFPTSPDTGRTLATITADGSTVLHHTVEDMIEWLESKRAVLNQFDGMMINAIARRLNETR